MHNITNEGKKDCVYKNKLYKARIVYTNSHNNGTSSNWRADYHKFKGLTYAQIVELKSSNKDSKNQKPRVSRVESQYQAQSKFTRQTRSQIVPPAKTVGKSNKVKVSTTKPTVSSYQPIECSNSFAILANEGLQSMNHTHMASMVNKTSLDGGRTTPRVSKTGSPIKRSSRETNDKERGENNITSTSTHKWEAINHNTEDKYAFMLGVKSKFKSYKPALSECKTLQLWDKQTHRKFGFIPLADQILPEHCNEKSHNLNPLEMHKIIKKSGKFNFLHCQLRVEFQLNADAWEVLLKDYWDKQLIQLIRHGFPLDFDLESPLAQEGVNHNSGLQHPTDIDAYLQEEMKFGAILGPFKAPPLPNMHHSPFMTREKPGAPHRRVIIDLSYPRGRSVNSGVAKDSFLGTPFILTLPTVDTVTSAVKMG